MRFFPIVATLLSVAATDAQTPYILKPGQTVSNSVDLGSTVHVVSYYNFETVQSPSFISVSDDGAYTVRRSGTLYASEVHGKYHFTVTDFADAGTYQVIVKFTWGDGWSYTSPVFFTNTVLIPGLGNAHLPDIDFDGDTRMDMSVYDPQSGQWFYRRSTGGSAAVKWGWNSARPLRGDFDGDRKTDFCVYDPATGIWYIRFAAGSSTATRWGWPSAIPAPGDYNGDGRTDFAVYDPATGQWYIKYAGLSGQRSVSSPGAGIPIPGDFDGDGKMDVAVYQPWASRWSIRFSEGGMVEFYKGVDGGIPVLGDFDGDGRIDACVYSPETGIWYIKESGPPGYFNAGASYSVTWGWRGAKPVPGDFDGDGKTDLAVYHQAAGDWYIKYASGGSAKVHWGWSGAQTP
jgi:hypothetical protein